VLHAPRAIGADVIVPDPTPASTPVEQGYKDFSYGNRVYFRPTAEKPQSKLWWNDGLWWGFLWDDSAAVYRIHRLDVSSQSWTSVGPNAGNDASSIVDVKWDGNLLYILAHPFDASGSFTIHGYSYDAPSKTYSLRDGFPVIPNSGDAEAATLDKDSTGKLWLTWEEGGDIMINTTQGSDTSWGTPFVLPVQGGSTSSDDISAIAAFAGKIGVMWSNQNHERVYFAIHNDGDPDATWQPREDALGGPGEGAVADDHLNFALTCDSGANVYAVVKTSLNTPGQPRIFLIHRNPSGTWADYVVGRDEDDHTRPIVVIDEENRQIYVFAKSDAGNNSIRMKTSDLDNISFTTGPGQMFIQSSIENDVNNPTSTKQTLNGQTDLLVLASDGSARVYMHNFIDLPGGGGTAQPDIAVTPASYDYGDVLLERAASQTFWVLNGGTMTLSVSGLSLTGADAALFTISAEAPSFTLAPGDSQRVDVTFVPISLGPKSAALSVASDDANQNPYDVPLSGNGAPPANPEIAVSPALQNWGQVLLQNTVSQSFAVRNDGTTALDVTATTITGADATQFTVAAGGGAFNVAPGDTHLVVVEFTPTTLGTKLAVLETASNDPDEPILNLLLRGEGVSVISAGGAITFEEVVTGGATASVTVATAASPTAVADDLYLASIASKDLEEVTSVTGMGMPWTLVAKQCGGRGLTGVEVWMARGSSPTNVAVTATFAAPADAAVIVVSRYSGAHSSTPFGTPVTASTLGISGPCNGTGADSKAYSLPIPTIADNGIVFGAVAKRRKVHTPDASWVERVVAEAGSGGSIAGVVTVDSTMSTAGNVTLSGTFDAPVDWAVVALEIIPEPTDTSTDVRTPFEISDRAVLQVVPGVDAPIVQLESSEHTRLRLTVHDVRGRLVHTLWNGSAPPGLLRFEWQPGAAQRTVPAGVYFVRAETTTRLLTTKLVLVR
jgi:hypothetical protein